MEYIKVFDELDSTMNEAKRYVLKGFNEEHWDKKTPIVFQAKSQSAGRGQHGKSWASPNGAGIYLSILSSLRIPEENFAAYEATQIVLGAMYKSLKESSFNDFALFTVKPINDIYWNHKKLVGTLIERFSYDGKDFNVVGIGINLYKASYQLKEASISAAKAEPVSIEEICGREKAELFEKLIVKQLYTDFEKNYFS